MRKLFVMGLAALMAASCTKSNTAVVDAHIEGADNKLVMVAQLSVNQMKLVDTVRTDSKGTFKSEFAVSEETPNFYYIAYNGRRLASLVLKSGDKVKVTADTLGKNVTIEGSEESVLMQKYETGLTSAIAQFEATSSELGKAMEARDDAAVQNLNAQLSRLYVKYKQDMIKSIMQNPYAFANVQALYQSLMPGAGL